MDVRLEYQLRKNPSNYGDVFTAEAEKMRSLMGVSRMDPSSKLPELCGLLVFLSSVAHHYDEDISCEIFNYAIGHFADLDKSLGKAVVTAITNLKKSKRIDPGVFYRNVVPLIEEMDKRTKTVFVQFLVSEIARDAGHWDAIKAVLSDAIAAGTEAHSKRASYIYLHMVSRGVWADSGSAAKVFEILLAGPPVVAKFVAMYLLDRVELVVREEEADAPLDEAPKRSTKIKRETKADKRKAEQHKKALQKRRLGEEEGRESKEPNITTLLRRLGPEGMQYGKKVFAKLKASTCRLDTRLRLAQVVSRIICFYQAAVKGFLPYMTRFMFPHQKFLPIVLSCIVQGVHEESDPGEVEAMCELIVENFCQDYRDDDIIAYGVNALRAILARNSSVAKSRCIRTVLDYKKLHKSQAVVASSALKKMLSELEPPSSGHAEAASDSDPDSDSADGCSSPASDAPESGNAEFVTEEEIASARKKKSKEQIVQKARAIKKKRRGKKASATTNKEKQKEKNYTVRKAKRKVQGKKLSREARTKRQK